MDIYFILVEPAVSGNIGATARALKTMGNKNLILVNSAPHLNDQAKMMGHGSWDVLENATVYTTFQEAVEKMDFLVGTSAKNRSVKEDYHIIDDALTIVYGKQEILHKVGIVFGREESGLTNEELDACDMISYIPLAGTYPSLNLSQAVMLYAYHFRQAFADAVEDDIQLDGNENLYGVAKSKASAALDSLGMTKDGNIHSRILERIALLETDDLHLLLSVCNKIIEKR